MRLTAPLAATLVALLHATGAWAAEHPGKAQIEKEGYQGPATCEACHPGKAK